MTSGAKVVAPVLVVRRILSILRLTRIDSSIFSLLDVAFFISLNVVPHLLVLLEKQPKHSIKFLGRLYLYFGVSTNRCDLFLKDLDALSERRGSFVWARASSVMM